MYSFEAAVKLCLGPIVIRIASTATLVAPDIQKKVAKSKPLTANKNRKAKVVAASTEEVYPFCKVKGDSMVLQLYLQFPHVDRKRRVEDDITYICGRARGTTT